MRKLLFKIITLSLLASFITSLETRVWAAMSTAERNIRGASGDLVLTEAEKGEALALMKSTYGGEATKAIHEILSRRHAGAMAGLVAEHRGAMDALQRAHAEDIRARQARGEQLRGELIAANTNIRDLQAQVAQHGTNASLWSQSLAEQQRLRQRLEAELEQLRRQADEQQETLRRELRTLHERIAGLEENLDYHRGNKSALSRQLTQAHKREETLRRQIGELTGERDQFRGDVTRLHEAFQSLQGELETARSDIDPNCREGTCKLRNKTAEEKVARLEGELAALQARIGGSDKRYALAREEAQRLREEKDHHESLAAKASKQVEDLKRDIETLKTLHGKALGEKMEEFSLRVQGYTTIIERLEKNYTEILMLMSRQQKDSDKASREKSELSSNFSRLRKENQSLLEKMAELQKKLDAEKQVSDKAKKDLREMAENVSKSLEKINELTRELQRQSSTTQAPQPVASSADEELKRLRIVLATKEAALEASEKIRIQQQKDLGEKVHTWNEKFSKLESLFREAEDKGLSERERVRLTRRAEVAESTLQEMRTAIEADRGRAWAETLSLKRQLEEVEKALEAEKDKVQDLSVKRQSSMDGKTKEKFEQKLREAQAEIESREQDIDRHVKKIKKLEKSEEDKEKEIAKMKKELEESEHTFSELFDQARSSGKKVERLEKLQEKSGGTPDPKEKTGKGRFMNGEEVFGDSSSDEEGSASVPRSPGFAGRRPLGKRGFFASSPRRSARAAVAAIEKAAGPLYKGD